MKITVSLARILRSTGAESVLACTLLLLVSAVAQAAQQVSVEPATGIRTWSTSHAGVHFSLTQILPQQADAFYVNRGFSVAQIEPYSTACVYMTVLRNDTAPGVIHFNRKNWAVTHNGQQHRAKTVSEWLEFFTARGVGKPALIAFRWAQFPPEQEYEPGGDWNQGMLAVGLPAGASFDIEARWDVDGRDFSTMLKGVECAE